MRYFSNNKVATIVAVMLICGVAWAQDVGPVEFMKSQIKFTQDEIKKIKSPSNQKYAEILQRTLMPKINFRYAGQLSLGKHWRTATTEEQERFITAFTRLLSFTYIGASRQFSGMKFEYQPSNYRKGETEAEIKVLMENPKNPNEPIRIGYRLMLENDDWSIYDIELGSMWLTQNYRTSFSSLIGRNGLPDFLSSLEGKAAKLEVDFNK